MSCTEFTTALSELADGRLAGEARVRVERHLADCAACRALLADLRQMKQLARALPKVAPPEDLWNKVSARLDAETGASKVVPLEPRRRWLPASHTAWGLMAAAAVLLMAVSTGIVLLVQRSAPAPGGQAASNPAATQQGAPRTASAHGSTADLVESVEVEMQQAAQHYEKALAGLEQAAREGQGVLDTTTAAVLRKNVGVLDQAIRESQAALREQPTSEPARTSLFEALQRKVQLLRDTVDLINEMRKGNQAGAAEIVSGQR